MAISDNLRSIVTELPDSVTLVAVSKTKPNEDVLEAYQAGQRIFGENKIQEMTAKYEALPKDIQWHMIGHIQTNKVKYMAPYVSLVHGCDREKVLKEINKEAAKNNRIINCLLQVHIAEEDTKFGFSKEELMELLGQWDKKNYSSINVVGLMGMATNTDQIEQVKKEFSTLSALFEEIKEKQIFREFNVLSMGMSGDYLTAIECGSTMVRIGSSIFGSRNY